VAKAGKGVSGIIFISQQLIEKMDIVAKRLGEVAKVGVGRSNRLTRSSFS
jgi:hypothetical protein